MKTIYRRWRTTGSNQQLASPHGISGHLYHDHHDCNHQYHRRRPNFYDDLDDERDQHRYDCHHHFDDYDNA